MYYPFVVVNAGDFVSKGDVIAYMYLPNGTQSSHIHFNLNVYRTGQSQGIRAPPDVWNSTVVTSFYQKCHDDSAEDRHWLPFGDCIAVDIVANESLYGEGAAPCVPDRLVRAGAPVANPRIVRGGCASSNPAANPTANPTANPPDVTQRPDVNAAVHTGPGLVGVSATFAAIALLHTTGM